MPLNHIQENELEESALQVFDNSISVGPVRIDYKLNILRARFDYSVYLLSVCIAEGTLSRTKGTVTVSGAVAGFKAEVTLTADFKANHTTYRIELDTPLGDKTYSGTLFSW